MEVRFHPKISYESKKPLVFTAFWILELWIRKCGLTTMLTLKMIIAAIIYILEARCITFVHVGG